MKVKGYLILLVICVLFSCNSQAGYVLKGVFKGAGNGSVVLLMNSKGKRCLLYTSDAADD